jgi:hypothetical protein
MSYCLHQRLAIGVRDRWPAWLSATLSIVTVTVLLICGTPKTHVLAQDSPSSAQAAGGNAVDPSAVDAIKKMSAYLRTLKSFQVTDDVTNDDVLDDGQIVQYTSKVDLLAARPNRLRVEVSSDDTHRIYFYDGKNFTVWGRLANYYATVPAPPTIEGLVDKVDEKYSIELPLVDLFKWGTNGEDVKNIKAAVDIGPSTVDGITCEHYAFHQENVDWQVWVQLGEFPLPLKLVITTLSDEARPQHSDTLKWNIAPSFNEQAFVFDPPSDAKRIVLAEEKADATQ